MLLLAGFEILWTPAPGVIRTRGIVVVDEAGRERIRIGAEDETIFIGRALDGIPGADAAAPITGLVILRGDSLVYSAGPPAR